MTDEGEQRRGARRGPVGLMLRALVAIYRYSFSLFLGRTCRYLPSCSEYADEALARHGAWAGGWLALSRISRCHLWGSHGFDPVPGRLPETASWYKPWRYGRWRGPEPGAGHPRG